MSTEKNKALAYRYFDERWNHKNGKIVSFEGFSDLFEILTDAS